MVDLESSIALLSAVLLIFLAGLWRLISKHRLGWIDKRLTIMMCVCACIFGLVGLGLL